MVFSYPVLRCSGFRAIGHSILTNRGAVTLPLRRLGIDPREKIAQVVSPGIRVAIHCARSLAFLLLNNPGESFHCRIHQRIVLLMLLFEMPLVDVLVIAETRIVDVVYVDTRIFVGDPASRGQGLLVYSAALALETGP